MKAKLQEGRNYRAKILIFSAIFLLLASPLASARSFIVYNTSAPAQAYFIVNGTTGNVGIGTTGPSSKLDVEDSSTVAGSSALEVRKTGAVSGTAYGVFGVASGGSTTNVAGYFTASGATNNYGLIVDSGNVGIGTASPSGLLHVKGSGAVLFAESPGGVRMLVVNQTDGTVTMNGVSVGIGTTSPSDLLHLAKSSRPILGLHDTGRLTGADKSLGDLTFSANISDGYPDNQVGGINSQFDYISASEADFNLNIFADSRTLGAYSTNKGNIRFFNSYNSGNYQEVMRISGGGNVGIGTTAPRALFSIVSGSDNANYQQNGKMQITAPSNRPDLTGAGTIVVESNDAMGIDKGASIAFGGRHNSSSAQGDTWGAIFGGKESATDLERKGYLALFTSPTGSIVERMRITSGGNVGIGNTNPQSLLLVGIPDNSASTFVQIDAESGAPAASLCDTAAEMGRMILDYTNTRLYVCTNLVWKYAALTT